MMLSSGALSMSQQVNPVYIVENKESVLMLARLKQEDFCCWYDEIHHSLLMLYVKANSVENALKYSVEVVHC